VFDRLLAWAIAAGVLVAIVTVIDLAKEREEVLFSAAPEIDRRSMDQRADQPGGTLLPGHGIERPAACSPRGQRAERSSTG